MTPNRTGENAKTPGIKSVIFPAKRKIRNGVISLFTDLLKKKGK